MIQTTMRHSTIILTLDRYTHLFKADKAEAIAKLTSLSGSAAADLLSATGTLDASPLQGQVRGAQCGKQWTEPPVPVD